MAADQRVIEIIRINSLNFYAFAMKFYPKLYPLTLDIYNGDLIPGDFIEKQV